jgi:cytochrome P450
MHNRYGPIVRIAPNEVHIADPDFYDTLYAGGSKKRNRDTFVLDGFGLPDTVIASKDHDLHRMRRTALNPFFSVHAIARIEPVVNEKLEFLCARLRQLGEEPFNVEAAIMAMTTDIITQYCFGNSYDFLKQPSFNEDWTTMMRDASEVSNFGRYFPWVPILMAKMPLWMVKLVSPSIMPLVTFTKVRHSEAHLRPD